MLFNISRGGPRSSQSLLVIISTILVILACLTTPLGLFTISMLFVPLKLDLYLAQNSNRANPG